LISDLGKPYSAEELAKGICVVLDGIADQLDKENV
jgi:hypothetical protein